MLYIAVINKTLGILSLMLCIVGLVGNLFTCLVCLRKRLRVVNTFLFMAILSACDLASLTVWNVDLFLVAFFNFVHENLSLWWCRIVVFVQYFSLQYSAWLLVLISLDRYLSIRIKAWRTNYMKTRRALVTALLLGCMIFLMNHHLLYLNGYVVEQNGTDVVYCYYSTTLDGQYIPFWHFIHIFIYSLVPFLILVCVNGMLIFRTVFSGPKSLAFSQTSSRNARKRTLTTTVVSLTVMFIITSLPYTLTTAIWYRSLYQDPIGRMLFSFLSVLNFSYHTFNFLLLFTTNRAFLQECKGLFSNNFIPVH